MKYAYDDDIYHFSQESEIRGVNGGNSIKVVECLEIANISFDKGGEITLTTEQVEKKLGRKLHWWNDDVVTINGIEYKKVFFKSEYKRF